MIILESLRNPGQWIKLTPVSGIGRKQWNHTEDRDEATRFPNNIGDIRKKLAEHRCPVLFTIHAVGDQQVKS